MGKKRKVGWKDNWFDGPFVLIPYELIDSKAYMELKGAGVRALMLCMRKVKEMKGTERFKVLFSLTFREAREKGFCDATFWRSMKSLQRLGFVDCEMRGGLRNENKYATIYRLSLRWKKYGTPDFDYIPPGSCEQINGGPF